VVLLGRCPAPIIWSFQRRIASGVIFRILSQLAATMPAHAVVEFGGRTCCPERKPRPRAGSFRSSQPISGLGTRSALRGRAVGLMRTSVTVRRIKWDSVAEKDFNFRTVDPAGVKEVFMTTSNGTCWVDS
jgi:hypothetical protein